MMELYNTILYEPIFNLLVWLYNIVPYNDIGLAIILLTIVVKLILLPLSLQAVRSQKALQELQPKMDALKKKYKDEKEKLAAETMKLYKEQKVNPLSSCLPLLIQFPFLIAVYQAFRVGLTSQKFDMLYSFVHNPEHINTMAFGFMDFAAPSIALAILAGLAQYVQTRMLMSKKQPNVKGAKDEGIMANMNKSMQYFMPFMTVLIGMSLPGGLTFYWFLTTVFTSAQQKLMFRKKDPTGVEVIPPEGMGPKGEKAEVIEPETPEEPKQIVENTDSNKEEDIKTLKH
ncbi:membrane protein insertase YidC [Candidatus Kuenenbacteria bacterium]|nr:membrane protein insertase YidC [Candidatus Kuenenbacteria bacterium]